MSETLNTERQGRPLRQLNQIIFFLTLFIHLFTSLFIYLFIYVYLLIRLSRTCVTGHLQNRHEGSTTCYILGIRFKFITPRVARFLLPLFFWTHNPFYHAFTVFKGWGKVYYRKEKQQEIWINPDLHSLASRRLLESEDSSQYNSFVVARVIREMRMMSAKARVFKVQVATQYRVTGRYLPMYMPDVVLQNNCACSAQLVPTR